MGLGCSIGVMEMSETYKGFFLERIGLPNTKKQFRGSWRIRKDGIVIDRALTRKAARKRVNKINLKKARDAAFQSALNAPIVVNEAGVQDVKATKRLSSDLFASFRKLDEELKNA